ncbi:MAG: hypothetical protein K0Q87_1082 [Neobacillus sp.]|jgi:hypothetical protein|nr:hypothetical protein [Neobacillus sp.]
MICSFLLQTLNLYDFLIIYFLYQNLLWYVIGLVDE